MLENHAHLLTEAVDVQFYFPAGSINIFFLCDIGRLPVLFTLDSLDKDMYIKILKEPKNAILKQYKKLLALDVS